MYLFRPRFNESLAGRPFEFFPIATDSEIEPRPTWSPTCSLFQELLLSQNCHTRWTNMLDGISMVSNALSLRYMHVSKIHKMQKRRRQIAITNK